LATGLAACGAPAQPGGGTQASAAGKVVFQREGTGALPDQLWDTMTASFKQANPKVEVVVEQLALGQGQSRDDKLFAGLASGTAWDVWQRDIPPSYQQPLVDQKAVLALDEYYASLPNLKKVFPWARSRSKVNGKVWGVPHEVEFIDVFYNKPVFEKAGIRQLPQKWDDFLALNRTLKASGVQPMNIAKGRTNPGHNYSMYLMGLVGKDGFDDLLYDRKRWDATPEVVKAAETMLDLQKQGFLPADTVTGDHNPNNDFPQGKIAMWGTGTWNVNRFEQNKRETQGFDYAFFHLPSENPRIKPTLAGGLGGGFSVWSQTKNKDGSVAWLDHLVSPTGQKHWIEIMFQVAPVPFSADEYKSPEQMKAALKTIAGSAQDMGYNIDVVTPFKWIDAYRDGLNDILSGKLSSREWAGRLQQEWDVARREGRLPKP
jgi:ABC-type glycerol-3-phosphate transport system substrate-binding protein